MNSTKSSVVATEQDEIAERTPAAAQKLAAVGWGLFFIWVGIALLVHVGWGVALLGVGVITLGAQAARACFRLPVERFWLVVGIAWVVFGGWELLQRQLGGAVLRGGPVPVLFIAVGVVVTVAALMRKPTH